jgi:VWFA-related protein
MDDSHSIWRAWGNLARFMRLVIWTSLTFFVTGIHGAGPKNLTHCLGGETHAAEQSPPPTPAAESPQVSQAPQEKSKSTTIEVSTRLVQASVVVEDKHGNPVIGLKKEDFTLLDDKQPQTISVFSVTTNRIASTPSPPTPPDTFTNRISGSREVPSNVAVILLDGLNTEFIDQAFARQQVINFLLQIKPQDRVALFTLGSELRILHDFTGDAATLLAALKRYKGQLSPSLGTTDLDQSFRDFKTGPSARDDLLGGYFDKTRESAASQNEAAFLWRDRAQRTLLALLQVAYHVSSIPGRKTLIWVSDSFPLMPSYVFYGINAPDERLIFADDFKKASRLLNSSTLVVYPVDAHGLTTTRPDFGNLMVMKTLAEQTGGKAFYNRNDLRSAIREAIDDSSLTYELGYYPTTEKWDGSFHHIKVSVNRKGLRVRTREGYLALTEPTITPEARGALASYAVTTLLEDTRLSVTVNVTATKEDEGNGRLLSASVRMDPRELSLKLQDGVFAGMVNLLFIQLDQESKVVGMGQQHYLLNLLPATYERSAQEGFALTGDVHIRSNATQLRVVLRDDSTGLAGAVAVPLEKYFPRAPSKSK